LTLPVNLPEVRAEVEAVFAAYEEALVTNDLATLDALFWTSPLTVRFGTGESLHGIEAIRAFRAARDPRGLARDLRRTVITTFGRDLATAMAEFTRGGSAKLGRQSQTWVRLPGTGWRIVAAHVSLVDPPA
jgi:hypothetical protein